MLLTLSSCDKQLCDVLEKWVCTVKHYLITRPKQTSTTFYEFFNCYRLQIHVHNRVYISFTLGN